MVEIQGQKPRFKVKSSITEDKVQNPEVKVQKVRGQGSNGYRSTFKRPEAKIQSQRSEAWVRPEVRSNTRG